MKKCAGSGRQCSPPIVGVFALALCRVSAGVSHLRHRQVARPVATMVEVIVTGSNIPTAEEVGPLPGRIPIAQGSTSNGSGCAQCH